MMNGEGTRAIFLFFFFCLALRPLNPARATFGYLRGRGAINQGIRSRGDRRISFLSLPDSYKIQLDISELFRRKKKKKR